MFTKLISPLTAQRSRLGQIGMLVLIIVALGVFGAYMLQPLPGRAGAAKSAQVETSSAINMPSGQDVLSVEWLEQQRATKAAVPSSARPQDDVLSVEWLEQNRQSNPNVSRTGNRAAEPILDNYIGFIE